jgi:predicted nuclease of predicted toxin-antitoxin system
MRLLANENFPKEAVEALQQHGHDVVWVRTHCPGISDREVSSLAQSENRILLTFDKDFGELTFRAGFPATSGVILFRILPRSPGSVDRRNLLHRCSTHSSSVAWICCSGSRGCVE